MQGNTPKIGEIADIVRAYAGTAFDAKQRTALAINAVEIAESNKKIEDIDARRTSTETAIGRLLNDQSLPSEIKNDCTRAVIACLNNEAYLTPKYEPKTLAVPALKRV